jgi:hypothetical protein
VRVQQRWSHLSAEAVAAGILAAAAAVMIAGCVLDALRLPLAPWLLGLTGAVGGATIFRAVLRSSPVLEPPHSLLELVTFLSITASVCGYVLWLASPSLLPVADGPDIVHHLSLVHTIQRTSRLPHGPAMETYLGEMVHYTPGSHVLAAAIATWLKVDALRVIYPVMAASVAVKSALLFLVTVRILPASRSVIHALAAPVLLMVPAGYFFGSILKYGFYAQVVAEMFAAGMLLAVVWWARNGARIWLIVFAACASAAFLAWPVWVPCAMLALFVSVLIRRPAIADGLRDLAIAFAPIVVVSVLHVSTHQGGASILGSAGTVTIPSSQVFGATFVGLACAGALMALRTVAARTVLVFACAVALQAVALAVLNQLAGSSSLYLPYKMIYLLVLPAAVLAAYALAQLSGLLSHRGRLLGVASAIVPLSVALPLMWGRIPHQRFESPITESTYAAGLWAREHLPVGCIDYFSHHWLTGYWLHLDVLGNPRVSPRMRVETFEFRETVGKWIEGRGLPYAIVEDMSSIPREVRPMMETLQPFGSTAVVRQRPAPAAACR